MPRVYSRILPDITKYQTERQAYLDVYQKAYVELIKDWCRHLDVFHGLYPYYLRENQQEINIFLTRRIEHQDLKLITPDDIAASPYLFLRLKSLIDCLEMEAQSQIIFSVEHAEFGTFYIVREDYDLLN